MKKKIEPLDKIIELIDEGRNIFITGGGGVGKSYLLNQLKEHYGDDLAVTSTTGVSAYNINGQTIHSFAGIYKNKIYLSFPDTKRKLEQNLRNCRILAIDEISMLHKETLDSMNSTFKEIKGCYRKPFGGVQMIFIGDFFQLPPVPKNRYSNSQNAEYCFKSYAWGEGNFITIDLQEVKRQSDKKFISALNKVRIGNITQDVTDIFKEREQKFKIETNNKVLNIFSKNWRMNRHNNETLKKDENCSGKIIPYTATDYYYEFIDDKKIEDHTIPPEITEEKVKEKMKKRMAIEEDDWAKYYLGKECRYPEILKLRTGCRVMLLKNIDVEKGLVNGSCGIVKSHSEDEVVIKFDKVDEEQTIEKDSFSHQYRYIVDENTGQITKKSAKRSQFPLQLAYAITIHKSQGMTFDELVVDLYDVFGNGMSYVALSRNRTLENLYIKHFKSKEIKTSQEVIDFYNNLKNCITFTEDGEMIEHFDKNIEKSAKEEVLDEISEVELAKLVAESDEIPETEDDIYDDKIEVNEYSIDPIEYYSNKLMSDPNNFEYLNHRAEAYYEKKEYDFALNDWNKILDIDSDYKINYSKKAYAEHKIGENEEAIKDYEKFLYYHPDCAAAHNNYGLAKECSGDFNYKEVLEEYNEAIRLKPDNCKYLNNRARVYYLNNDIRNAIIDWDKILEINPEYEINYLHKARAENELAQINFDNEDYKRAIYRWNKVLDTDPEYEIEYSEKAYAEYKIGNYDQAIDDYSKYLENYPDAADEYCLRGLVKECSENYSYEDAIEDYTKAIELEPNNTMYLNNRARAYYWDDEYTKAVDEWNKILEIDSEYEINYYWKAYAENEIGSYEDALSSIKKYLSNNPDDEDAFELKNTIEQYNVIDFELFDNENLISEYIKNAESYYWDDEYTKAVDEWNKILEIDPEYKIDYFKKGYAERQIGNNNQAIADYTKHLENNPDDDAALNNRGLAKECSENYTIENAIEDYNKAIQLKPDDTMYLNNRARAYFKNAKKDYLKILEDDIEEASRLKINEKLEKINNIISLY